MNKIHSWTIILVTAAILLGVSGCSYFNTFYDVKKTFREAERDTKRQQTNSQAGQAGGTTPGQPGVPPRAQPSQPLVAVDKYRKVIETASKLLEFYPKSRWIDDALLLMGISYYRMQDYSRSERKFTELIANFPQSKLVPEASLWKARAMVAGGRQDDAVDLLRKLTAELKGRRQRGDAEALLANTEFERQHWEDAATNFKAAAEDLPAGEPRNDVLYHYGVSEFNQKEFAEALKAFLQVARNTRDHQRSFDASIYGSRAALAAGDAPQAEQILRRLKQTAEFEDLAGEVDLELANLAVQTGRVDEGISAYQKYLEDNPTGEKRSLAYFRLADVFRIHRLDLQQAKSLLDSAMHSGGSKEISDSAKVVHEEIAQGLQVLTHFKTLQDSVAHLEARRDTFDQLPGQVAPALHLSPPQSPDSTVSVSKKDTGSVGAAEPETVLPQSPVTPVELKADSLGNAGQRADSAVLDSIAAKPSLIPSGEEKRQTPADSSLRVSPPDSVRSDSTKAERKATPPPVSNSVASPDSIDRQLSRVRSAYQLAAMRVAEFYGLTFGEPDSALSYYRIAARTKDNPTVYWKANLYLAEHSGHDSARADETQQYYRAIVDADSVPRAVMRQAREALGLAVSDTGVTAQTIAFRSAEQANFGNQVSPDSAVMLYANVVGYDSTSPAAMAALFAELHLYEDVLHQQDSSLAVAHRIIGLFPDSSFTEKLRLRVLPPDSGSIFLKSDEQLYPALQTQGSVVEEKQTEGGWPPPEESLRGRRFQ